MNEEIKSRTNCFFLNKPFDFVEFIIKYIRNKEVEVYFTKLMLKTLRGCIHITVFCTRITDTSFYL